MDIHSVMHHASSILHFVSLKASGQLVVRDIRVDIYGGGGWRYHPGEASVLLNYGNFTNVVAEHILKHGTIGSNKQYVSLAIHFDSKLNSL